MSKTGSCPGEPLCGPWAVGRASVNLGGQYCKLGGFGLGLAKPEVTIGTLQHTNSFTKKIQ